jgi:hypothetical protein
VVGGGGEVGTEAVMRVAVATRKGKGGFIAGLLLLMHTHSTHTMVLL